MIRIFNGFVERLKNSVYWRDIGWLISGQSIAHLIGISSTPLLSRLFRPEDFATANLFAVIVGFLTIIATWRYETLIQLPKSEREAQSIVLLVVFLGGLSAFVFTPICWIWRHTISILAGDVRLAPWLVVAPVAASMASISLAIQYGAQRVTTFRNVAASEIAGKSAYSLAGVSGHWILPGAGGLVVSGLASSMGKLLWFAKSPGFFRRFMSFDRSELNHAAYKYRRLAGSLVVSQIMMCFYGAVPSLFIAREYGANSLGQFNLAYQFVALPTALLGTAIGRVFYQRSAEMWAGGHSFISLWRTTAKKMVFIGLPLYSFAAIVSPWAFPWVFGKQWVTAGNYASFLCISSFFAFISAPLDRACLIVSAWWYDTVYQVTRVGTSLLVIYMASIYHWPMLAFLMAFVLQSVIMYLVDFWAEWRFSNLIPEKGAAL